MSENTLIEPEEKAEEAAAPPRKRKKRFGADWLRFMNVFEWFDRDQIVRNIPFILYVTVLVMFYIANTYYAERLIRQTDKARAALRERSAEFVSTRSQMMFETQQSEVAKSTASVGLVESKEPPHKLIIKAENKDNE